MFVVNDVPLPLGVNLECLDDGSGIANTLLMDAEDVSAHISCSEHWTRDQGKSQKVKRPLSPNKTSQVLMLASTAKTQCVCCEKFQDDSDEPIYRARSDNYGKNLYKWATKPKNCVVHARLNTAIDVEVRDEHYHTSCYTKLKNDVRAAKSKSSNAKKSFPNQQYDHLVAQFVAFAQFNHSTFNLVDLRKLYDRRLKQLGSDWIWVYVHQTRFK